MRKIISSFASSADGYIETPTGGYHWIPANKEIDFAEEFKRYDTFFFGRRSYEKTIGMKWPMTKGAAYYVFSATLKKAEKPFLLINGNIKEKVTEIKQQPGKDIYLFGGANLLASFLELQLVDEIDMAIIPVLLGSGKPLVDLLSKHINLSLKDTKTYSNGTVRISYDVKYS